jgi:pyruvate,water dikinase
MTDRLWVTDTLPSKRFPVYTRANSGEVYAGVLKPLGWSTSIGWPSERGWRNALARYGAFDLDEFDESQPELVASFGGYIYLNLSAQRILGVRTPGVEPGDVDRAFFGDIAGAPGYTAQAGDDDPRYTERVTETFSWIMSTPEVPDVDTLRSEVYELRCKRPDLTVMEVDELVEHIHTLLGGYGPIISLHFFIINCATVPTGIIQAGTARHGRPDLAMRLMSGFSGVDSAAPAKSMQEIASTIDRDPLLRAIFDTADDNRWELICKSAEPTVDQFREAVEAFLFHYGWGGPDPYDVAVDSWETDVDLALSAINNMRQSANRKREVGLDHRRDALEEVRVLLREEPAELAQIEAAVAASAIWVPARERSKSTMTRLLNEVRIAVFELGRKTVARGVISDLTEMTMLAVDELTLLDGDPSYARQLIDERMARFAELSAKVPPFFVEGEVPPLDSWSDRAGLGPSTTAPVSRGDTLHGLAACPGVATGTARVVTSSLNADIDDGEILIAPYTDAGWAPLFLAAAAVVVDVGAPLSHAAIISRELGVPCVVSCTEATRRIPDGATVTVDGTNGLVHVL